MESPAFALFMLAVYIAFAWKWKATFKVLGDLISLASMTIMILIGILIGVAIGAYQVGGGEIANQLIAEWSEPMAAIVAAVLATFIIPFSLATYGAIMDAGYRLLTTPEKVKRYPQNLGGLVKPDYIKEYMPGYVAFGYNVKEGVSREVVYRLEERANEHQDGHSSDDDLPFKELMR